MQSKMVHLRFKSPLQVSLGPDISGLNVPTQEMNNHIPVFFLRFCKRTNSLLKFSQDSINLGLTISSQCVHVLGQRGQPCHKCMLLNPI